MLDMMMMLTPTPGRSWAGRAGRGAGAVSLYQGTLSRAGPHPDERDLQTGIDGPRIPQARHAVGRSPGRRARRPRLEDYRRTIYIGMPLVA